MIFKYIEYIHTKMDNTTLGTYLFCINIVVYIILYINCIYNTYCTHVRTYTTQLLDDLTRIDCSSFSMELLVDMRMIGIVGSGR